MSENELGRTDRLQSIIRVNQSRDSAMGRKERPWRDAVHRLAPYSVLSLPFYRTHDYRPRSSTTHTQEAEAGRSSESSRLA